MTTEHTSTDPATQPLGVGSSEGLGAGAEARKRRPALVYFVCNVAGAACLPAGLWLQLHTTTGLHAWAAGAMSGFACAALMIAGRLYVLRHGTGA